jgi:DNA-binding transcriptional regulator YhcF (GntR family)
VLKLESDEEVSRSVTEVVWEVSDNQQIIQSVKCLARPIAGLEVETARGDIITFIPLIRVLPEISDCDRNCEEFRQQVTDLMRQMDSRIDDYFAKEISAITEETKNLVKQVVNVINFSHLMWPWLVEDFLPEVREMCETLRITGDNIFDTQSKGYQGEYIEGILGRFRNAEAQVREAEAQAKAERQARKNAEGKSRNIAKFFREKEKLGDSLTPKALDALLVKHNLTKSDIEATPRGSPSKPKVGDSPSPSRK